MEFERMRRRSQGVNLTPLVDVFFLLMIFFMLSTSFVKSESMELMLPGAGSGTTEASDVMQLRVLSDARVEMDGKSFSMNQLDKIVREALKSDASQKILILSTPGISVQELVTVMDIIHINGGRNVQIDHHAAPDLGGDVKLSE